jgi:Ca2+-binding EF-hand superfamily protein
LAHRSDDKTKGVNKITFTQYYELPGIISDRLFAVFDKNQNNYIDVLEFIDGMKTLFTEGFEKTSKFIFDFYDFNKDGFISKADIQTVLSYVSLKNNKNDNQQMKFEMDSYRDRVESQEEIYQILEKCFKEFTSEEIDYFKFVYILENICSDIYFFILIFLYEKKPFSKITLQEYEKQVNSFLKISKTPTLTNNGKLLASPNLQSKFSPSIAIGKSPSLLTKSLNFASTSTSKDAKDFLMKFSGNTAGGQEERTGRTQRFLSVQETSKSPFKIKTQITIGPKKDLVETMKTVQQQTTAVNRKPRNNLKNIEQGTTPQSKNIYTDLPIIPAVKLGKTDKSDTLTEKISQLTITPMDVDDDYKDLRKEDCCSDEEDGITKCEGYLYKLTETKKVKKLWFKLIHKDLYYFKSEGEKEHKGMHNLSGVFVTEEKPLMIDNFCYFCFGVIYPRKIRYYYVDNDSDYKMWLEAVRRSTGYSDLNSIYEVKEKLGNGKFGLVRLGIHRKTGRKVAIKIMAKKDMNTQDLELVKCEIEIMKVCQHPNIIRLYDIFENNDYIYLIMEHCSGGDLFSYIEKRGFKLPEHRAAQIIHKLCTAIFYIHSYGIAHRDLKPENILMTDCSDNADIRLLDFGLSKIIGPTQNCTEPYGTLSYVAPEVLLEKPYTKAVDLWSIGITTYLLLCGTLPFDDAHSEREIARQTIHDPVPYNNSIWKKISPEAKTLVDNLLQKDFTKRMDIRQVLEHPWIQKYNKSSMPEIRRKSRDYNGSNFQIYSSTDENETLVKN